MNQKPLVVQHTAGFDQVGGPTAQLRQLMGSRLSDSFQFEIINQSRPAKGINIPLILEMASAIRKLHPDLVHVRGLQNEGFHGVLAALLAGRRNILVSVHGFASDRLEKGVLNRWVLANFLEPLTLMMARRVYCVCFAGLRHPIIRTFARHKSQVIYNGIQISELLPHNNGLRQQLGVKENDRVALFTGRIVIDKGIGVLAEALKMMENPPMTWIAGEGEDGEALQRSLGPLVESGRVRLLGRRKDVPELLSACDFFIFPTLHENFSNSLLEAMHAARAVLATNVGGNPELVIDGVTGKLIPPGDPRALAENLALFSANPEMCAEMGRNGRERIVQHFSLDRTVNELANLYSAMLVNK